MALDSSPRQDVTLTVWSSTLPHCLDGKTQRTCRSSHTLSCTAQHWTLKSKDMDTLDYLWGTKLGTCPDLILFISENWYFCSSICSLLDTIDQSIEVQSSHTSGGNTDPVQVAGQLLGDVGLPPGRKAHSHNEGGTVGHTYWNETSRGDRHTVNIQDSRFFIVTAQKHTMKL